MSVDLVEFLQARLTEDEAVAREAADGDSGAWFVGDQWNVYRVENVAPHEDVEENRLVVYGNVRPQSAHIVRHNPARVLIEIKAKLLILTEVVPEMDSMTDQIHLEWGVGTLDPTTCESLMLLRILALPYDAHPDYRPEWAPEESNA